MLTRYFKPEDFCITHKGANVIQLLANFMTILPQENLSINPDILMIVLEPRGFGDIFNGKPSTKLFGFHFFDLQPDNFHVYLILNMVSTLHSVYKTEHILALEEYENGIRNLCDL